MTSSKGTFPVNKQKFIIIDSSPINTCSICKKSFSLIKMASFTDTDGLMEMAFRTEHVSCRKHNEKMEKLTNEIQMSISANKFHQGYIKDLKQQKLQAEYDFFINC